MQNREWKHSGDAAATTGSCSCTAPPAGTRLWAFAPAQPGKPQFSGCDSAIVRSRTSSRTSTASQAENCPFSSLSPLTDAGPTDAPSLGRYAVSTAVHEMAAYQVRWRPQCCPPPDQITLIHHPGHPADSLIIISESTQINIYIYNPRIYQPIIFGYHQLRFESNLYPP